MTVATKSRGIFMSAESVDKIWADLKTQTRRLVRKQPTCNCLINGEAQPEEMCKTTVPEGWQQLGHSGRWWCPCCTGDWRVRCPYGVPGELLWVRRTRAGKFIWRKAEADLWLRVVTVRPERLQEITNNACISEGLIGFERHSLGAPRVVDKNDRPIRQAFAVLWDSLNAERGHPWSKNDWVWVIGFERVTSAISDQHKETK